MQLDILLIIFILIFSLILLIRLILNIVLFSCYQIYKVSNSYKENKNNKKSFLPQDDEELFREKEQELQSNIEKLPAKQQEEEVEQKGQIVDIVKPVGFWTSMVLGQKLTYLVSSAQLINKNKNDGFWTAMIKAQARAQGREKGRSR